MKTHINGNTIEQLMTNAVILTQAQYDALPNEQKTHGTYIISDSVSPNINANNVEYSTGVSVKDKLDSIEASVPTTYAGSGLKGGAANMSYKVIGNDTRTVNSDPQAYINSNVFGTLVIEFKNRTTVNAPGTSNFGLVVTLTPWKDNSGGYPVQFWISDNGSNLAMRGASNDTTWKSWNNIIGS